MKELYEYVINFMADNIINCVEDIYQKDFPEEVFQGFVANCFEEVKNDLI